MNTAGPGLAVIGALAALGLLAACAHHPSHRAPTRTHGGGYYQNDGPPDDTNIDVSKIPDAVPRNAPRSKYGNPSTYTALGRRYYVLKSAAGFTQTGRASWYGRQFHGERTSSGEPYNMFSMTAAHKRLPIPTWVRVTNLDNGRQCIVKINDRGPFHDGRIIDLSYVAARRLGIVGNGSAPVRIRTVTPADYRQAPSTDTDTDDNPPIPLRRRPGPAQRPPGAPSAASAPSRAPASVDSWPRATRTSPGTAPGLLQIGAFSERSNALELKQRILDEGLAPVSIVAPTPALALYRVRVGPFSSIAHRDAAARALLADGYPVRRVDR